MRIGTSTIGAGATYVIAEIGANHDGKLDNARRLIAVAAECGANAAKFQFYRAHDLYPGQVTEFALPDHWLELLKATAYDHELDFICSVFSLETLDVYLAVEPVAVKVASPEATDQDLLAVVADSGVTVLVATGACTQDDLDIADAILGLAEYAFLHCVSAYPAPNNEMNLSVIPWMRRRYLVPVGLSDHTVHPTLAPTLAVAAGASIVEKHLTPDRTLRGPDHAFALEPGMFRSMVTQIRVAETMLGDGVKRVMPSEDPTDRRRVTV